MVCFEIKKLSNDERMQLLICACTHISQLIVVNSYPHIDTNEKVLDLICGKIYTLHLQTEWYHELITEIFVPSVQCRSKHMADIPKLISMHRSQKSDEISQLTLILDVESIVKFCQIFVAIRMYMYYLEIPRYCMNFWTAARLHTNFSLTTSALESIVAY